MARPHRGVGRRRPRPATAREIEDLPDDFAALDRAHRDERAVPRAASVRSTPTASSRACASARRRRSIVIVNHHLLCADASVRQGAFGEVIPDVRPRRHRRGASARGRRHAVLRRVAEHVSHRRVRRAMPRRRSARVPAEDGRFAVARGATALSDVQQAARAVVRRRPARAAAERRIGGDRVTLSADGGRAAERRRHRSLSNALDRPRRSHLRAARRCPTDLAAIGRARRGARARTLEAAARDRRPARSCTSSRRAAAASVLRAAPIDVADDHSRRRARRPRRRPC